MDLNLTHQPVCINEVVFNNTLEQSIELDYFLPDYCPSIFKVLKCKIVPKITSQQIANSKICIDGIAYVKVIYTSEGSYKIKSIEQKQAFSKTVDLNGEYDNPVVIANAKCDYVNCRVVNSTRLDIRGAISIKTVVSSCKKIDALCDANGLGVQLNKSTLTTACAKLVACKEFTISEQLELNNGKPPLSSILYNSANAVITDCKIISNKAILKGDVLLHTLYATDDENCNPEIMEYSIPFSQIVDIDGIDDDYKVNARFNVTSVDFDIKSDDENQNNCFEATIVISVFVEATKNSQVNIINDCYSTCYETNTQCTKVKIEKLLKVVDEVFMSKNSLEIPQSDLSCIYDITCEYSYASWKLENNEIIICGNLEICIIALDCENMPIIIEKTIPCEIQTGCMHNNENIIFNPVATIISNTYSLSSNSCIDIRTEIKINGIVSAFEHLNVVTNLDVNCESKKVRNDNCVLRLYFASEGECVWNIAKRFNTSINAIIEENSLDNDVLSERGMLLIPIID